MVWVCLDMSGCVWICLDDVKCVMEAIFLLVLPSVSAPLNTIELKEEKWRDRGRWHGNSFLAAPGQRLKDSEWKVCRRPPSLRARLPCPGCGEINPTTIHKSNHKPWEEEMSAPETLSSSASSPRRPNFTPEEIHRFVEEVWGFRICPEQIRELPSYDDQNFLLRETGGGDDDDEGRGREFVCKIFCETNGGVVGLVDLQHEVMRRAAENGVGCPGPIPNLKGAVTSIIRRTATTAEKEEEVGGGGGGKEGSSSEYICRLLPFIPGKDFTDAKQTEELLEEVGEQVGRIDVSFG